MSSLCIKQSCPPSTEVKHFCLFLYILSVPPDTWGGVSSSGSAGVGRRFQHRCRPALPRLPPHHLSCDWHQKPLLRPLLEVHANWAVWNCGDTWRNSRNYRWVTQKMCLGRHELCKVSTLRCVFFSLLWLQEGLAFFSHSPLFLKGLFELL